MTARARPKLLSLVVRDDLAARILDGRMAPGSQLPSEPELAAQLGVSRATLREALRSLGDEGLVKRTRGAGTFVSARPRLVNNLDANFGVTDAIRACGMRPGSERGSAWVEPASPEEAVRLGVEPGEDLVVVERVRTADGRPVVLSRDLFPARVLGGRRALLERMLRGSVYEVLERALGVVVHHGVAAIRPARADRAVASRLQVPRGSLLLYLDQVDYDEEGRPVLSSHEHHLADAFEFTVIRRGPGRRYT